MSTPDLRRRLKAYWAEYDRVKALRRQILEAAREDDEARFEFFCDHGYAPPVIFPDYPEFPPVEDYGGLMEGYARDGAKPG